MMSKTARACLLVLLLASSTSAGTIHTGSPEPPPPPAVGGEVPNTAAGIIQNGMADELVQAVLSLLTLF